MSNVCFATAWLRKKGELNIYATQRESNVNVGSSGIIIPYGRKEKDIYAEYGITDHYTITQKIIFGRSGSGLKAEKPENFIVDFGLRTHVNWAKIKIIPRFLYASFSNRWDPEKPPDFAKVASVGFGIEYKRYDRNITTNGLKIILAQGEQIYNIGHYNFYIRAEVIHEITFWNNLEKTYHANSNLVVGKRGWEIGYRRVDEIQWGNKDTKSRHTWKLELAVPFSNHQSGYIRWGYDRPVEHVAKERIIETGMVFKLHLLSF